MRICVVNVLSNFVNFLTVLIFWLWYRSSTSSKNYADALFNTRLKFVFIWRWRFSYKFLIVVCFLSYFSKIFHFEIFRIIVACVHSTLWHRVDVVFRAFRLIYSWFDCRNRRSACDVRALLIDFWRRFAYEINENEWIEYTFFLSKFSKMWLENSLKRYAERFSAFL